MDKFDPTLQWERIKNKKVVEKKEYDVPLNKPEGAVRFVCISDTHSRKLEPAQIPLGDVLIHAGDFTQVGKPGEVESFSEFLGSLPHEEKVVIAGNHDLAFDTNNYERLKRDFAKFLGKNPPSSEEVKSKLKNCIYLQDSAVRVKGVMIYGSPWQPWFHDWGFNLERGPQIKGVWDQIPEGIDILITHGPPLGHGDLCFPSNCRAGCFDLLEAIERIRPRYHVFGHIHEGYGVTTDGVTDFINASTCDIQYKATQPPIVFDFTPDKAEKAES
mmetsp:Transcript_16309/g.19556  ORF Transcript_16309/g.19556 Transcript_16309/m.19556 type:complete len:272 (-) Transcript_16309:501-1316(-)